MIITDDQEMAERIRYLSTTAKQPHRWEFIHDEVGYNLRLPSLNAAIGVAQLEYIDQILENKRITADLYRNFFSSLDMDFVTEPRNCLSNYWLNAIVLNSQGERDALLAYTNDNGVQTRPVWRPLHLLQAYCRFQRSPTPVAEFLGERLINIPSSYRLK